VKMGKEEALEIIKSLADGIDPFTGEVLPIESPYQNSQIIRALFAAISALEKEKYRSMRRGELPNNAGKPWSEEENRKLVESFDSGTTIEDLANIHERTRGAIRARLIKLGKVQTYE